jgi:hypothetical protein
MELMETLKVAFGYGLCVALLFGVFYQAFLVVLELMDEDLNPDHWEK